MNQCAHRCIVVAVAVVTVSSAFSFAVAEPVARVRANPAVTHLDKAVDKEKAKADTNVTKLMAALLDDLLSTDGQGGIVANLEHNDANRIGEELKKKHETLDKLVTDFRAEWVKHYQDQYNASNHLGILSADKVETTEGTKGGHYAAVAFDSQNGIPDFTLKFVKEKDSEYRLMLPNDVDGAHLVKRLENALSEALKSKDSWPKGQSVAYAATSHRLLYALRTELATEAEKKK